MCDRVKCTLCDTIEKLENYFFSDNEKLRKKIGNLLWTKKIRINLFNIKKLWPLTFLWKIIKIRNWKIMDVSWAQTHIQVSMEIFEKVEKSEKIEFSDRQHVWI